MSYVLPKTNPILFPCSSVEMEQSKLYLAGTSVQNISERDFIFQYVNNQKK